MFAISSELMNLRSYYALARRLWKGELDFLKLREQFYADYWSKAAREIGGNISDAGHNYYRITKNGKSTFVQCHHVNLDTYMNLMMVSQKPLFHKMLIENGYPVPEYKEYDIKNVKKASDWMRKRKGRFVIKPSGGSGGYGITTGINNDKRLRLASIAAAAYYYKQKIIMIEEEFAGDSYRLLYLNGKLIDAIRRNRPTVVGDGKNSIRQLIHNENMQRYGCGPSRSLSEITIDLDCKFCMEDNGISLDTVPMSGETVIVKNVANQNSNRDNFTVRDNVHPYYHELGKKISSLLGLKLIGIDVMASDVAVPLDENGGVINEINIPPGLHYHELIANSENKAVIGPKILEYVFQNQV